MGTISSALVVTPANYHDLSVTTEHENTPLSHLFGAFFSVIPAEAGIQKSWIPVFTGMTELAAPGRHPPGNFQVKAGVQEFHAERGVEKPEFRPLLAQG